MGRVIVGRVIVGRVIVGRVNGYHLSTAPDYLIIIYSIIAMAIFS